MRALEKLMWKAVKAQENHIKSCDKLWDWENEESIRVDSGQVISASCYAESVMFLMKQAKQSQKRLLLFKHLAIGCRMYHEDCTKELETQIPSSKKHKRLTKEVHEAAGNQAFMDEWVTNEKSYFEYIDELLTDVFERFTSLYTRENPTANASFDYVDEPGEDSSKQTNLTRH